eukprot:TRINITY_DN1687_c0_g1_i4.p2 TRINITY_DN1687_c0_g1~~TRINITY_DN1687_c0_g1_i4.p2  ORF type:complete len:356 (+),score=144.05 TRINITY_DN1687_c0_g1_i4:75-1142(+)
MDPRINGSRIRLISNSGIRYEGTLCSIDPVANTVSLEKVRMFGTEGRQVEHQIPPSDILYSSITFRGSDIKDLTVYEHQKSAADFIDPAVVQARPATGQRGEMQSYGNRNYGGDRGYNNNRDYNRDYNNRRDYGRDRDFGGKGGYGGYGGYGGNRDRGYDRYDNRRTIHDKGDRRGGYDRPLKRENSRREGQKRDQKRENPLATHTGMNFTVDEKTADDQRKKAGIEDDFDFEKAQIDMNKVKEEAEDKPSAGYDKAKSFFDSLSCEATDRSKEEGHSRLTKTQREANHNTDIETFGTEAVTAIEQSFSRQRGSRHNQNRGRNGRSPGGKGYGKGGGGKGYGKGGRGGKGNRNRW